MLLVPTKSHLFLNSISESVVPKTLLVFFVVTCSNVLGIACLGSFLEESKRVIAQAV